MTRQQRMVVLLQDLLAVCQKHNCVIDGGSLEELTPEPGYIRLLGSGYCTNDFYIRPDHGVMWIGSNRYYVGKQYPLPFPDQEEKNG